MSTELYLCSTPLHILNAVAIASTRQEYEHHIWLIDQPIADNNPYFDILNNWDGSPFKRVNISAGQIKGTKKKLANRKLIFSQLKSYIEEIHPSRIYTGNDRRIEFQYAMHCCAKAKQPASGIYMDEGTFTYVGRAASSSFSDQYVDNLLKKLTYGFWWKNPSTIGGSKWITEVYAAFPHLVHEKLKAKKIISLQEYFVDNNRLEDFCGKLVEYFGASRENIATLTAIITLPHESIINRQSGYSKSMSDTLEILTKDNFRIGVKYHPRNTNPDILNASENSSAYVIPHKIPFEAILPLLPNGIIIGDISSTLINAKWLKPKANLVSIANPEAPMMAEFKYFFSKIGVETISANEVSDYLSKHHTID
ncbi:polysialyltransferase family glycosyltransferase [Thalassolituus sp.]|jgi:hypothetical protein|uniref:polysialyltransferase family glycosyltransferase n=1 Tax=Thalassolituus sp. TaxID=2030822 RepID=UPI002A7ED543|nr:polysialyltransferase family glycosyltransferase [Thalassolituus sp.]